MTALLVAIAMAGSEVEILRAFRDSDPRLEAVKALVKKFRVMPLVQPPLAARSGPPRPVPPHIRELDRLVEANAVRSIQQGREMLAILRQHGGIASEKIDRLEHLVRCEEATLASLRATMARGDTSGDK